MSTIVRTLFSRKVILEGGFQFSSQMVDRLCVQVQDSVNALKMGNSTVADEELEQAEKVIRDADNSKQVCMT